MIISSKLICISKISPKRGIIFIYTLLKEKVIKSCSKNILPLYFSFFSSTEGGKQEAKRGITV